MSKILLLEPHRLLAEQYVRYLTSIGHSVRWCGDVQNGITTADSFKPDIVILELLMVGHSGIEFLYEFRSYADWLDVPVVVLSSANMQDIGVSDDVLGSLGVSKYLWKSSTSLQILGTTVSKLLLPTKIKTL